MKKLFVYALSAVALLAVSCNNKNNPVQPSAPATKDLAQVIKFSAPLTVGAYSFQSIELTEASRFIAEYTQTKAILSETDVLFGKFTFSNGVFELEGLGSMKIEGNTVTLNPSTAGGGPVQAQATITPTSSSDPNVQSASRNWKITKVIVGITGKTDAGKDVGGEKIFSSLDLGEVAKWAKIEGLTISDEDMATLAQYNVTEVCLTAAGSFVVDFSQAKPIHGNYNLATTNLSINVGKDQIPFLADGKITGTIQFSGNNCTVEVKTGIVYNDVNYNATLAIALTEIQ